MRPAGCEWGPVILVELEPLGLGLGVGEVLLAGGGFQVLFAKPLDSFSELFGHSSFLLCGGREFFR